MSFLNVKEDATVHIYFETLDSNNALVAPSASFVPADFVIYKNGSAVHKATTNGITVTSPFDGKVGKHKLTIDTSNDTGDPGFWATNSSYHVAFETATTIDGNPIDGRAVPNSEFGIEFEYEPPEVDLSGVSTFDPVLDTVTTDTGSRLASQADVSDLAQDVADLILETPANKLTTNASGQVESSNMRGTDNALLATSYTAPNNPSNADIATAVWANTSRTLSAFAFQVTVGTNNDKSGYSLTQAFPANFAAMAINGSGEVTTSNPGGGGGSLGGEGSETVIISADDGVNPIAGVDIWIRNGPTDSDQVVAGTLPTNANGQRTFWLDPGTYYVWRQLSGYNFSNPEQITVTDV